MTTQSHEREPTPTDHWVKLFQVPRAQHPIKRFRAMCDVIRPETPCEAMLFRLAYKDLIFLHGRGLLSEGEQKRLKELSQGGNEVTLEALGEYWGRKLRDRVKGGRTELRPRYLFKQNFF